MGLEISWMTARWHVLAVAGVLLGGPLAGTPPAGAVDPRVEAACSNDYFAHCGVHDPEGPAVRRCMRENGEKLSKQCVDALVEAGEVSAAEVARRSRRGR